MEDQNESSADPGDREKPPPAPVEPDDSAPNGQTAAGQTGNQPDTPESGLERDMVKWTRGLAVWTKTLAIVTVFLVLAAVLQFCAMESQLGEMKATREGGDKSTADQLSLMRDQAKTMQGQVDVMRAESRPWVSIGASVIQPFIYQYNPNGTNIALTYKLYNSGRSPANNVWIELATFPMQPDGDLLIQAENTCSKGSVTQPTARAALGFTLFPNETITVEESGNISKEDIDRLNFKFSPTIDRMDIWSPIIIACVVYRSPPEEGRLHHTPLILNLRMKRTSIRNGRGCCAIFIDDGSIAAADLSVERMMIGLPAD